MKVIRNLTEKFKTRPIWSETFDGQSADLRISEKLNIAKINLHWGREESPETTYILIINNKYILNCNEDVDSNMNIWASLFEKKSSHEYEYNAAMLNALENQHYIYDDSNTQLIYGFEHAGYTGDYFFHFGHFFLDALPTMKCIDTLYKKNKKYNKLYHIKKFHKELLQENNLTNVAEINRQEAQRKYVTAAQDVFYTWIEIFDSQQLITVDKHFGLFCHLNKILDKKPKCRLSNPESKKRELKGLYLSRGKTFHQRFKNSENILGDNVITLSDKEKKMPIHVRIESIVPEEIQVCERISIAENYDFVIGSPGSHMLPSIFYSNVKHFFAVPFIPTNAIVKKFLPGFIYFQNKFEWISDGSRTCPDCVDQTVFDEIWFKDYTIDCDKVLKNTIKRLIQTSPSLEQ